MKLLWKDILREVGRTKARIISLVLITALGAMTIVGIQASSINMRNAADKMYKEHALFDLHLQSPAGFTAGDISTLRNTHGVAQVMPAYSMDVYVSIFDERRPLRTFSLPDTLNRVTLIEGRLPENYNEIAVEQRFLDNHGYSFGDSIELSLDDAVLFGHIFAANNFTIVGTVSSPLFITFERGRTLLGAGTIRYYAYLHPEAYTLRAFTDVYIEMDGSRDMFNLSHEYNEAAEEWRNNLMNLFPDSGWSFFTRKDGTAFEAYFQDTLRLQQIGYVFPVVFFLVAVLVSLTSMSRMVEEHRTQMGIYKALGFKSLSIFFKYGLYATISGILGGVFGIIAGSQIFPRIIVAAYGNLYRMPPIETPIPWRISLFAVFASVLSVLIITIVTCVRTTSGAPAELLRPKAPKPGKRVLIERVAFIWKRLGFMEKVTARNIFRYKRRFFMTLAGVAGCTALIVTALGMRHSLLSVAGLQFGEIIRYDAIVHTREIREQQQRDGLEQLIPAEMKMYVRQENATVQTSMGQITATLIVPECVDTLSNFVHLETVDGVHITVPPNGVVLTEKLARDLGISVGDFTELVTGGGEIFTVYVQNIVENYVFHYVYMTPEYYRQIFAAAPYPNTLMLLGDFDSSELLQISDVRAVVSALDMKSGVSDSTNALGMVTILILFASCALSFIVLFNLTIINLAERRRELATIKVLGFQNKETTMYIGRENLAVTILSIVLGLIIGFYLNNFIVSSIEVDILKFPRNLTASIFVYAAVLSFAFTLIVNLVTHRKLTEIDMVESLKSIE